MEIGVVLIGQVGVGILIDLLPLATICLQRVTQMLPVKGMTSVFRHAEN